MMKSIACLSLGLLVAAHAFGQGALTPTGAPAPTMRSLDQIEPRTPISSLPITINTPGSYFLTGNLSVTTGNAITLSADDVSIDLNGFTISSSASPAAGTGISISGVRRNIIVTNGKIRGTTTFSGGVFTNGGFASGLNVIAAGTANVYVSRLQVSGVSQDGIDIASLSNGASFVENCSVTTCGAFGIRASLVRNCTASTTGNDAINALIAEGCIGDTVNIVATASGVRASDAAQNCRGTAITGNGVFADGVINCAGVSTSGSGITGINVQNSNGTSSTGSAGISANPGTVTFSRGRRDGGTAIATTNAIGCTVAGTGTVSANNKLLGTPP